MALTAVPDRCRYCGCTAEAPCWSCRAVHDGVCWHNHSRTVCANPACSRQWDVLQAQAMAAGPRRMCWAEIQEERRLKSNARRRKKRKGRAV